MNTPSWQIAQVEKYRHMFPSDAYAEAERRIDVALHDNYKVVDLCGLPLTELPHIPDGIISLSCSLCYRLMSLPETLPDSIEHIYLFKTPIKTLPNKLPNRLSHLWCSESQLEYLPETLPDSLNFIDCSHTKIKKLPEHLPASLETLMCHYSRLSSLPQSFPESLWEFECHGTILPAFDYDTVMPQPYLQTVNSVMKCKVSLTIEMMTFHDKKRSVDRCKTYKQELIEHTWHPSRIIDWCGVNFDSIDD